jgi:hypothetical protein
MARTYLFDQVLSRAIQDEGSGGESCRGAGWTAISNEPGGCAAVGLRSICRTRLSFNGEAVASLAKDLAAGKHVQNWIIDICVAEAASINAADERETNERCGCRIQVWTAEGVNFFAPHGWQAKDVQEMLKTAAQFQTSAG